MNKETAKDYLPLVQALAQGKVIQYKYQKSDKSYAWMDLESNVDFGMPADCYQIKPEPREIWVNEYPNHPSVFHPTRMDAINCAMADAITRRYREVIE